MDPSLSPIPPAPAEPRGVGREGTGQAGISPGSPSWGGAFNHILPRISPAPSQAPGQACVCRGDLGWPDCLSFRGQLCLLSAAARLGGRSAGSQLPGADGPQWESARPVLRGLAPFFPPFVRLSGAARAQTTKAACSAASGGAGVTADSRALGDGGTLCERESPEHPGSQKALKSWATPRGSLEALICVGAWCKAGGTPRVVYEGGRPRPGP